MTTRRITIALVAAALAAPAASAQETLTGSVRVAPTVTRAKLKRGLPARVSCSAACSGTLTLAGPVGILTHKTVSLPEGAPKTVRLKAPAFMVKALDKGAKLSVTLNTSGPGSPALAHDTTRLR